jgi:hypothetical protein
MLAKVAPLKWCRPDRSGPGRRRPRPIAALHWAIVRLPSRLPRLERPRLRPQLNAAESLRLPNAVRRELAHRHRSQRTAKYVTDLGSPPAAMLDERIRATTWFCSVTPRRLP